MPTARKLWMGTWNMGNTIGDDQELKNLAETAIASDADLVVLGLQEAKVRGSILKRFGKKLGSYNEAVLSHDHCKVKVSLMGCTKPFQESPNTQRLGIYVHPRALTEVVIAETDVCRTSMSGKGACIVLIDFAESRLAFVTCHLGTKAKERDGEVKSIITKIAAMNKNAVNHGAPNRGINGIFLMGDLNYRLNLPRHTDHIQVTKRKLKVGPKKTKDKEVEAADASKEQLVNMLAHPIARFSLTQFDTLQDSGLVKSLGFNFPIPKRTDGSIAFPTYKRKVGDGPGNPGYKLGGAHTEMTLKKLLWECYFSGDKYDILIDKKQRGAFDIGWLDRIGFYNGPDYPHCVMSMPEVYEMPKVWSSDHSPVYMKCYVMIQKPLSNKKVITIKRAFV